MSTTPFNLLRRLAVAAALCGGVALAGIPFAHAASPAAPAGEAAAVKKLLEQRFPGAEIRSIEKSPYFGLYEVQFDDQMIYTDSKAKYVLVGSIFDAEAKVNLTEEKLRKLNRIAWNSLPLELAMKKVKGNGSRKVAVFSDADCPFCKKLEEELAGINDVTIYTFLYPIDQLHPDAARKSKLIWCAPDKVKAWDEYYASGKLPDNKGECQTPLDATQALGQKLRVTATPTLVFADGTIQPGAIPAARLDAQLKQAEVDAKKLAAQGK